MLFLHTYLSSKIMLNLGLIKIHWYGFLMVSSMLAGFWVFNYLAQKKGRDKKDNFDLFFYLIIGGIVGGRLYHVFSEFSYYWHNPLKIFYLWQGGLGIYGGVLAGIIVVYFFAKKMSKKNIIPVPIIFLTLLDMLAPAIALGQAIGRWGNYFNQELYGAPTNFSWGIPISLVNRLPGYENFNFFQPLFLYESLFCLLLFVFLLLLFYPKRLAEGLIVCKVSPGTVFFFYIFLYALWRFFIEFLRIDPQPFFNGLRLGQWSSLILLLSSLLFYIYLKKWYNKNKIKSIA